MPSFNTPNVENADSIIYMNVGHADILDNMWANFAKSTGLWKGAKQELIDVMSFKKKKGKKIKNIRKEFRNFVVDEATKLYHP